MTSKMPSISKIWKRLNITRKFSLTLGLLVGLNVLMAMTSLIVLRQIRIETETAINHSTAIQHDILEMDRGLQKARRLEMQFFFRYPTLGYAEAYQQYALPAAEQIVQVAAANTQLEELLSDSKTADIWQENTANSNLYILAINRHIASVEEATQLIAQLAADETGLIPQLTHSETHLLAIIEAAGESDMLLLFREMQSYKNEYLVTRQRSSMQAAFNLAAPLQENLETSPALNAAQRTQALKHLDAYLTAANEVLDVDVAILGKFNEFDLQAAAIQPITTRMIHLSNQEVENAQKRITTSGRHANSTLLAIAVIGMGIAVSIALALNQSITRNIIKLTNVASLFEAGRLNTRAQLDSGDELGQLAATFNRMAARLRLLVGNLESQVEARTSEIAAVNQKLLVEIDVRKKAENKISLYSQELEDRVAKRTQQLVDAQERSIRQERLAAIGQLAGSMGHELRNPIGVLSNAVYFLNATLPDADGKTQEFLDLMDSEIKNANKIISDLLDFARIKSIDIGPTAVSEIISKTMSKHPPTENINVIIEAPEDLPPVHVDSLQIAQVLGNLVTNAYQAMPQGGRLIIKAAADKDFVSLSLADTGTGISPENMSKVFEPLFTTKAKGIGLGLAICKNLVEANGGSIEVESKMEKGAAFRLQFPTQELAV
jgi:signal transduction histidine kinase